MYAETVKPARNLCVLRALCGFTILYSINICKKALLASRAVSYITVLIICPAAVPLNIRIWRRARGGYYFPCVRWEIYKRRNKRWWICLADNGQDDQDTNSSQHPVYPVNPVQIFTYSTLMRPIFIMAEIISAALRICVNPRSSAAFIICTMIQYKIE